MYDPLSFGSINFRELPGLIYLQSLGEAVLGLGFVWCLGREALALIRQGVCDLLTPLLRMGLVYCVLEMLPTLGNVLYEGSLQLSGLMAQRSHLELFSAAFSHIAEATSVSSAVLTTILGANFFWLFVVMTTVKIVVIDILFPVALGIVLTSGALSVPFGVFPGADNLGGWVRNLIEVSLYPVCFQLVIAQFTSQFNGLLKQVAEADFTNFFGEIMNIWQHKGNLSEAIPQSPYFLLIKFFSICIIYIILTGFSPVLSAMIVRSKSAGFIGGMLSAKATSLMAGGSKMLAGSAMVRGALAKLAAGSALGVEVAKSAGSAANAFVNAKVHEAGSGGLSDMNKRNVRSSTGRAKRGA